MSVKERRARHHAELERLIFATAGELLEQSGTRGVSLRAVAEHIEYSPAAIYHYFAKKNDLLRALAAEGFRRLATALTRPSSMSPSAPLLQLREFFWRYYVFSKTHPAYYELMFLDASYQPASSSDHLPTMGREADQADALIRRCTDSGLMSAAEPAEASLTLWTAVHGAAVMALRKRLPAATDPDRLVAELLDVVLAGLR